MYYDISCGVQHFSLSKKLFSLDHCKKAFSVTKL